MNILIHNMVLGESKVENLLKLEKNGKIKIKNQKHDKDFKFFDIDIIALNNKNNQKNILKFDKKQRLAAAKVSIKKSSSWVSKTNFEKIMDGTYEQVDKQKNETTYKNGKHYIKLVDMPKQSILQIVFGKF